MHSNPFLMILAIGGTTFLLKSLPFILFKDKIPENINYLGKVLPYGIMAMLIVYSLKTVKPFIYPYGLPELISILIVVFLHLRYRNTLVSIAAGTIIYMVLIQLVFI